MSRSALTPLVIAALGFLAPIAGAQESGGDVLKQIDRLADAKQADDAVKALVAKGQPAVKHLLGEALEGTDLTRRGWAIVCLGEIGGENVSSELTRLHQDTKQPMLVRTWAAAARVKLAKDTNELSRLASLASTFPAVGRPIAMRLVKNSGNSAKAVEAMLELTMRHPQLAKALGKAIAAKGGAVLVEVMFTGRTNQIRRQAAAYVGGAARSDPKIPAQIVLSLTFDPKLARPPWDGNALFLPALRWNRQSARALVSQLVRWYLWAERHNRQDLKNQIHNNLRSVGLSRVAGYRTNWRAKNAVTWLQTWKTVVGSAGIEEILTQQGVQADPVYQRLLR